LIVPDGRVGETLSARGALNVMGTILDVVTPPASVAFTVTFAVIGALTLPVTTPVWLPESPGGRNENE
jgi:hypothetical protein